MSSNPTRTFSCGELKTKRFKVEPAGMKVGETAMKVSQVNGKKANGSNGGNVYRIKPGSRILKINNAAKLDEINKKYSSEKGTFFDRIKDTYDGVSIDKKVFEELSDDQKELVENSHGIKVLNPEIMTVNGEKNEPYRTGFKANATELSKEMKEVAKDAFNNSDKIREILSDNPNGDYRVTLQADGIIRVNNRDVTEVYNEFNDAAKKIGSTITLGRANNPNEVSFVECLRTKDLCEKMFGGNADPQGVVECLGLYNKEANKVSKEAYNKAAEGLRNSLNIVEHTLGGGRKVFTFETTDIKALTNVSKEALHREKLIWNNVLSKVSQGRGELAGQIAQLKMQDSLDSHLDNRQQSQGTYKLGNININFKNPKIAPQSFRSRFTNRLSKFFSSISSAPRAFVRNTYSNLNRFKDNSINKITGISRLVSNRLDKARGFVATSTVKATNSVLTRVSTSLVNAGNSISRAGENITVKIQDNGEM